ncbi:GAF domain-containing sensor histidine kinase [Spirosoma utsteinense]|uniref:histidine kinase n=1 Tax=Spirosoma utsteinense TaxID=2585773 RepID=A0ABR6WFC0_9BACT|nr:GAF domain-containing sensor histidine kinase [Spirosoma utsteinense]MBC3789349.1 signal transduction histidine kinase [Spirosoma utsteinense]MBC3795245.1 signal transduction histidine kinase [Spirosoma utsteinense]
MPYSAQIGEVDRIRALASYNILDTLPEEEYDAITQLAALICQMPISLISLIDEHRQWFKSAHGLTVRQTPREYALCAHAIQTPDEIMEVHDARTDERFIGNPLITGDPNVVFYAGTPLVDANGYALGTLCVIDHKPSQLTAQQKQLLKALGRQVVVQLELHRSQALLQGANEQLLMLNQELQVRGQFEQRLQHRLVQEKELSEQKTRFVAMVSHEFRTPLTSIQLSVDLVRLHLTDPPQPITKHLAVIEEQVGKFTDLLSDVLILGQIDAGKLLFNPLPCDAGVFVEELIGTFTAAQLGGRTILTSVEGMIQLVPLDKKLLSYALINLVSNALKYSAGDPVVHLSYEPDGITFAVTDTGIGIPAADIPHLFTSFFRATNALTIAGTGLGLFIARQFVELHGGHIDVTSQHNQGSTFRIVLPTVPAQAD